MWEFPNLKRGQFRKYCCGQCESCHARSELWEDHFWFSPSLNSQG